MITKNGFSKRLEDFPVYKQETDHTCGPASVRMILEFLGDNEPERRLARNCLTTRIGTLDYPMLWGMNRFLKKLGYMARMLRDDPAIYEQIKESLLEGLPVLYVYSTTDAFHPPRKCLHYSAVIGLDEPRDVAIIANPFGLIEEVPLETWWAKFSHEPEEALKLTKVLMQLHLLKPRTAFRIHAKDHVKNA
ncbi:MAG TPA: C39 family peptidase [Candidatus Lokiarchaeia archaeon]|nr:C39 family peptidase [Candidatus Lokiarchaeia archaeon]